MTTLVKICGLSTPDALEAALAAGADMVGFVHFPPSPRHLALEEGSALSRAVRRRATRVLLMVDPDDATLDAAIAAIEPDMIQLHGGESPERVEAVRRRTGRQVAKAIGIAKASDLDQIGRYAAVADAILLDAKPAPGATRPGGLGAVFDWSLLAGLARPAARLILSGGLHAGNVAEAIAVTGLSAVDVSSGVESRPGEKDPQKIEAFVRAARAAFASQADRRVA